MSVKRIIAVVVVYLVAWAGWIILGMTTHVRSTDSASRLGSRVEHLWGGPLVQNAPSLAIVEPEIAAIIEPVVKDTRWLMPSRNEIQVELQTDYRKKGLIWYPTYTCSFDGTYTVTNTDPDARKVRVHFDFPSKGATYDKFAFFVGDERLLTPVDTNQGIDRVIELPAGKSKDIRITYATRGMREWRYRMDAHVRRVQNLNLTVNTGFRNVDYPEGSLSPDSAEKKAKGMILTWARSDLITSQDIGVVIPEKLNPGPLTSRITFFAPVCLIFFFVLIATINILYKVDIHPMHYLFVAAGFFAFHLLLAYMVGIIHIHIAFVVSAVISVSLVTSYMAGALKGRFPWKVAVAGQLFFLVLFSYSFFLKGITGLTVAIGSVVTLAVLMKVTAHVDWNEVFSSVRKRKTPPPLGEVVAE